MQMKKIIFKSSFLYFFIFLLCSKIYSYDRGLIVSEIKNRIESNQDIADSIKIFYTDNLYEPYWQNNKIKINDLLNTLSNSHKQGIPTKRYGIQNIINLNSSKKETDIAKLDIMLTEKFLLHAKDLTIGVINPLKLSSFIEIKREDTLEGDFLNNLKDKINIKEYFDSLRPKNSDYLKLMIELANLKVLKNTNANQTIVPNDITLEVGVAHPNVIPLRKRLLELNILENLSISETFDDELLKSVLLFQENSGLVSDGVIGKKTYQALNLSTETKLIQIMVNLERLRWLNFDFGTQYILINQANYEAKYVNKNNTIWKSKVVIGLPDYQTAEFFDEMTHIIVNPTWHVPKSIAVDEYLPKIQEDPEFLINNEMLLYVRGTKKTIDPNLIDMSVFTVDNFPFEIKQNPGNLNALGQVKFMFPNKHSIYMHDTPMKSLFSKDLRAFSHGCVRLARPFEFANALLSGDETIDNSKFYSALNSSEETRFNLDNRIPVYMSYRTVLFDDFGIINYRPDIYGRDALVYLSLFSYGLDQDV